MAKFLNVRCFPSCCLDLHSSLGWPFLPQQKHSRIVYSLVVVGCYLFGSISRCVFAEVWLKGCAVTFGWSTCWYLYLPIKYVFISSGEMTFLFAIASFCWISTARFQNKILMQFSVSLPNACFAVFFRKSPNISFVATHLVSFHLYLAMSFLSSFANSFEEHTNTLVSKILEFMVIVCQYSIASSRDELEEFYLVFLGGFLGQRSELIQEQWFSPMSLNLSFLTLKFGACVYRNFVLAMMDWNVRCKSWIALSNCSFSCDPAGAPGLSSPSPSVYEWLFCDV